jgi:hypothetical protein
MSSAIPTLPAGASAPVKSAPKPPPPPPPPVDAAPKYSEHHRAASSASAANAAPPALSSTEVSYVQSLLGVLPAQKMAEVMLRTGVPIPEHLGPNVDTTA